MATNFNNETRTTLLQSLKEAVSAGNAEDAAKALEAYDNSIMMEVRKVYDETRDVTDSNVLAARGVRQLTSAEKKYYEKLIEHAKNPKMSIDGFSAAMPRTIFDDVMSNIEQDHPLLQAINFQPTTYLTDIIRNKDAAQTAAWGEITEAVTKEVKGAFTRVSLTQSKLTAFFLVSNGVLDLGPAYIDLYVRTTLAESIAAAFEAAIISGTGKNMPVGLDKDIHAGVSVSDGVYPDKTATKVTKLDPKGYGALVASLAKDEQGKAKKFDHVSLICNLNTYLTKIMPATTQALLGGGYAHDIFPFATNVIISNEVKDDVAILANLDNYFLGVAMGNQGKIEYDDSYKFLEDQRTYKTKLYATGMARDNTDSLVLDVSKLKAAAFPIENLTDTATQG